MIQKFDKKKTKIAGLYEITSFCASDIRGLFIKDYSKEIFKQNGITHDLVEVFYTVSHKGVIRGMHFQRERQQPKLVRCVKGEIYDVVVDLRKDSPTFKKWLGFKLNEKNNRGLLIPIGCAHGYIVLQEGSIVCYKCSEKFYSEYDDGIIWNDPEICIHWPLELVGGVDKIILSDKDKRLQTFAQFGGF
jgi:dTDP-4-dehydrorhamnose 3,5-epimerase